MEQLEIQLHRELDLTRGSLEECRVASVIQRGSSGDADGGGAGRGSGFVRVIELRLVEEIERLRAELQVHALAYRKRNFLEQREVDLIGSGADDDVSSRITVSIRWRSGECRSRLQMC